MRLLFFFVLLLKTFFFLLLLITHLYISKKKQTKTICIYIFFFETKMDKTEIDGIKRPTFPSLTKGRRPRDRDESADYWRKRWASGPTTGDFGIPTHVDSMGRQYRTDDHEDNEDTATQWICRVVRKRPRKKTKNIYPRPRLSRAGGQWSPKWPLLDQKLVLFRLSDQKLGEAYVKKVFAMPVGVTARIVLKKPLNYIENNDDAGALINTSEYLDWVKRDDRNYSVLDRGGVVLLPGRGLLGATTPVPTGLPRFESERRGPDAGFPRPTPESL